MTPQQFKELLDQIEPYYKGIIAFLYYTGCRVSEALALQHENFRLTEKLLYVDKIKRLKHSKNTEALAIDRKAPGVSSIEGRACMNPVFPYTRQTIRNILKPFGLYPHYFRMNRISQLFMQDKNIVQVQSWTGLTINALNAYIGKVSNEKIGREIT
jgi:integrase